MHRTIVSLLDRDNLWVTAQAKKQKISKTELIRRAVSEYRKKHSKLSQTNLEDSLSKTSGMTQFEDGVEYQEQLRSQW